MIDAPIVTNMIPVAIYRPWGRGKDDTMYWPIRCLWCGKEFERSGKKRYCKASCRQADYRARRYAKIQAWSYCEEGKHLEYYSEAYNAFYQDISDVRKRIF